MVLVLKKGIDFVYLQTDLLLRGTAALDFVGDIDVIRYPLFLFFFTYNKLLDTIKHTYLNDIKYLSIRQSR